jgi:hypothetical protein
MEASFTILFLLFVIAATLFWIWALVDVIRRPSETLQRGSQLLWALVIALTHTVGAAAYVLLGRPGSPGIRSVGR